MKTKQVIEEVKELLKNEQAIKALDLFRTLPEEKSVEYFLIKGKLDQKYQKWGAALNSFSVVLEIDPENSEAKNNVQILKGILNFWNPEMFNP